MRRIVLTLLVSLLVLALVVLTWALVVIQGVDHGEQSAVSASPTPMPSSPSTLSSGPLVWISPTPIPTPTNTIPPMADIDGIPVHIEILRGANVVVGGVDIVPIVREADGRLVPPDGQAGVYYSQSEWNMIPGNLGTHRGIIAGHNTEGVFLQLANVKKGDSIVLTYQLNGIGTLATAEFTVLADAVSAPKDVTVDPNGEFGYIWQAAGEPGRLLTVFTCDLATAEPGEHAKNNWVVNATRTK